MTDRETRRLLLVVGIGRSGTSVFTGILGQLGWHVPQPEVQADDTNPRGFGEPQWVVDFHTGLLRSRRVTNMDSRPAANELMDAVSDDPAVAARLRTWLDEQFGQSNNVVVKDPRIVWFLPLWRRCAEELGVEVSFATMLRYPTEVLTSARRSYGTWQSDASRAAAWVNVMLHTEQATRGAPRAFVRYDDLLTGWEAEIKRIAVPLQVPWLADIPGDRRAAVDGFVDPSLRRSQLSWDHVDVPDNVRSMIDTVWAQLTPLTAPESDGPAVHTALDQSRATYQQFYADVEALAHSSIHAAKQRKGAAQSSSARAKKPTLAKRVAQKVPPRYRRLVPVGVRRRLLGSR
jgi:hypothetical protein